MEFMALIYADEDGWEDLTPAERDGWMERYAAFSREARDAGVMVDGDELAPGRDATTIRVLASREQRTAPSRCGPYTSTRRRAEMRYALLVYNDQSAWAELTEEEAAAAPAESMPKWIRLFEEMGKADPDCLARARDGVRLAGDPPHRPVPVEAAFREEWTRAVANPGAWIVTTARNRAVDRIRRERVLREKTELLEQLEPTPVVRLNRAAAIALAGQPADALVLVDELEGLDDYRHLHATRADLLRRLGRADEADAAYRRALALTENAAERRFLQRRLGELREEPRE